MGNPFVRSGLSFSFPTSIFPPLKPPLHETLLTRIPIGFPKHRRTLPPHSSSSSSNFDIISTTESWDGSLLFRFGDESEKSVTTETATDAQSHLEDPVQDSKLSQTLLGRRGSGGGGGAAAEADETVDAHSATTTDSATGGGGEETTTTRSITTITTITTEDETQLSNEIHAFPAIGTAAAEAKENAVDVVSITSTSSATGRGDGGEKTTITTTTTTTADGTEISNEIPVFPSIGGAEAEENAVDAVSLTSTDIATGGGSGGGEETTTRTNETQVSKEIRAFPAIGTAAADAKENVVDPVSVTSTNIATGGGGSGGGEETTTTTTITTATITDETQVSDEIPAFPAIGGAEAEENAVDAVSVTSTDIVSGGGGGGEETTTTTTRTTTTVETQVSNDIHAEGEEYAADAVSATSTTMATGGEETTTTTTTEETQLSNEIHAFPANGGAKAEENAVDAVSVMSTGIATGGGEETTTTTTTTTDETQVSNEIHAFPAIGGAEAEENAVDAVSVTSTNIATGGGSGGGEETTTTITTTTYETQVTNDIHAETEENAVDAVSVTSTSIATGGGRGGAEETTTTTTTTTEETQVSNEIDVFPAISSAEAEENAVDAVSVTSTGIAKGGGSGSGEETTTTTEKTQVSNEIDVFPTISSAEAEENAVDAVSVTSTGITKGGSSGSGEETTTTTTTTTEETQVSNDIHAFPAIGGAKENAVDVVSVTSTSTATGGGSGGGEETTTTTTTRTTTDETQVSNEIFAFPAISGVEAEENAVDAVSVASTNIVTGGCSGGGQETTTTTRTTTDETQVSNDIHAQAEENAVDAVSVTISNNATSGGGEETTTTITTTATITTTSDETQVSPVLAENAPSTNPEDEFTEGKADTTDVSGISTSRIVEFNTVEGASDGEDVSAAVLQLSSSAALLPHPSKVGRMLTLLVAKIG